jgi:hypothetical protein
MSNLILIGCVNSDLMGPKRLERILNHYKPSIVGLEQTPKSATKAWQDHLDLIQRFKDSNTDKSYSPEQIERLNLIVNYLHFETWVPKTYKAGSKDIALYPLEIELPCEVIQTVPESFRKKIQAELDQGRSWRDILNPIKINAEYFVRSGSIDAHQEKVNQEYENSSHPLLLEGNDNLLVSCLLERYNLLSQAIRNVHTTAPNRVMLAVLENSSVFGEYPKNIFNQLIDLDPQRMRLSEADTL